MIPGCALALQDLSERPVRFMLHGDESAIAQELARAPQLKAVCEVRHTALKIAGDEKPALAVRRGRGSSLWNAVEAVGSGAARAAVSGGNTGALMAIARRRLGMAGGLDRPALVASWPTARGVTAVLDVGANIECDSEQLVEFAIMGEAFYRAVHGAAGARPSVGLLNVGSEDQKGREEVRLAHHLLREIDLDLDYRGFVEGNDIAKGAVDVVVTDGFTGNVALKTGEGLARFFGAELRAAFSSSLSAKLGALLARAALRRMRARLEPPGGGPFLGLNGVVVKSHGGADAKGVADAVRIAAGLAASDYAAEAARNIERLSSGLRSVKTAVETSP
jgi:glycerol-3-phosphate acyltransferase PlsX